MIYFNAIFFAANAAFTHSIIIGKDLLDEDIQNLLDEDISEQAVQAKLPILRTENILQQDPEKTLDKKVTKDEQPGANLNSTEELHVIQSYQQRNISNYTVGSAGYIHNSTSVPRELNDANCLFFKCNNSITKCDTTLPTDHNRKDQPCCVHILREMSRVFDDEMHRLGLDYMAAFGTKNGETLLLLIISIQLHCHATRPPSFRARTSRPSTFSSKNLGDMLLRLFKSLQVLDDVIKNYAKAKKECQEFSSRFAV